MENLILWLVSELALNIGFGIYINRVGGRNNDYRCGQAGRMKCIDMFYGFNHPIYREVAMELRKRNISFSNLHSTQNTNHQSGNFKLEERVKTMKRMAHKGNITAETWPRTAKGVTTK